MSVEFSVYVFSDQPETREMCKAFLVKVLGYKPENSKASLWPFIKSKPINDISAQDALEEIYKKASENPDQTFTLIFDVYGFDDFKNGYGYWDAIQKNMPNIAVYFFSLSEEKQKDGVLSLAAILNEIRPEFTSQQTSGKSERDQESDKQDSNLVQTLSSLANAISQINTKVETLSQNMEGVKQDLEAVKATVSKETGSNEVNLQLRRELSDKLQQASSEMNKAKRNEKQWVEKISSFLDSLDAEASNQDLNESNRKMAERYFKALLRYLEPLQFEKIALAVGDEWNSDNSIRPSYSETETVPLGEPLRILEIQEQGYKYQGILVKPAVVIIPKPVQTTSNANETTETPLEDVNNKSAE
ncbi:MAG: hypothetical protein IJH67_11035 [Thermoguttaceae bacterium]|nr:hypothetical protein [Thermoguttaceae bacterium]